jgi:hypothetical protein
VYQCTVYRHPMASSCPLLDNFYNRLFFQNINSSHTRLTDIIGKQQKNFTTLVFCFSRVSWILSTSYSTPPTLGKVNTVRRKNREDVHSGQPGYYSAPSPISKSSDMVLDKYMSLKSVALACRKPLNYLRRVSG